MFDIPTIWRVTISAEKIKLCAERQEKDRWQVFQQAFQGRPAKKCVIAFQELDIA